MNKKGRRISKTDWKPKGSWQCHMFLLLWLMVFDIYHVTEQTVLSLASPTSLYFNIYIYIYIYVCMYAGKFGKIYKLCGLYTLSFKSFKLHDFKSFPNFSYTLKSWTSLTHLWSLKLINFKFKKFHTMES